jgi:hypothetical protein
MSNGNLRLRSGMAMVVVLLVASCASTASQPPATMDPPVATIAPTPIVTTKPSAVATPATTPIATPFATRPVATASPSPAASVAACLKDPALDAFASALLADLTGRDPKALAARMSGTFEFVVEGTDVAIPPMSVDVAAQAFVDGLKEPGFDGYWPLAPAAAVRCLPGITPAKLFPGNEILKGKFTAAFLTTGWGTTGGEEAFLYLSKRPDGSPSWRGTWYSLGGFER